MTDVSEETPHAAAGERTLLTRNQWFTIGLAIFTAILTVITHIGIREWYRPDVRYEEGAWYRDGTTAIVSLRIKNYGSTDAERVRFTAGFDHRVRNVSLDDPMIRLSGDPNMSEVFTGEIDRLVPKQTAVLYFSLSVPSSVVPLRRTFVRGVAYVGGQGATGEPLWRRWLPIWALCGLLGLPLGYLTGSVYFRWQRILPPCKARRSR